MTTVECNALVNRVVTFTYTDEAKQTTQREVIVKEVREKRSSGLPYLVCFDGMRNDYRFFHAQYISDLKIVA
jgi:predicted DNA-binding transcriptional regulator YafY